MSDETESLILDKLIAHTQPTLTDDRVTTIGSYCFYGNTGLREVSFQNATRVKEYAFQECWGLNSISIPQVNSVGGQTFKNCPVGRVELPSLTSTPYANLLDHYGPGEIDLSTSTNFTQSTFQNAWNLMSLVLRSPTVLTLGSGSLTKTPISAGYGWIYVPDDLVDTYKAQSSWSNFSSRIVPLSEYPKAPSGETINDSWADIFDAEDNNLHTTKYALGDTKFVKINGTFVCMQIVGMDQDELTEGGNAKITWMCKGAWAESIPMILRQGGNAGWGDCYVRQLLHNIVFNNIQSDVKSRIKSVRKTWTNLQTTNASTEVSDDYIWIPSRREVIGGGFETYGTTYRDFFSTNAIRIKYPTVLTNSNTADWWLRTGNSVGATIDKFQYVSTAGSANTQDGTLLKSLVFGFCT